MPLFLGCIRADVEIVDRAGVLPRRAVGQSYIPLPDDPVVSLLDLDLLRAVLDGLDRMDLGSAR